MKEIVITIRERPPVEFETIEDLKRYVDSLPKEDTELSWKEAVENFKKNRRPAKK